jgi:hypothetical protein
MTYGVFPPTAGGGGIDQLTGDVLAGPGSGSQPATVVGLQGNPIANAAPNAGQVLTWNGASWAPAAASGGGAGIGLYANRPAAGNQGAQYYSLDATGLAVDDGFYWRPIVSSLVCRQVDLSRLATWINQAGATATQYGDAALINFPNVGGNSNYTARVQQTNAYTEVIGLCRVIANQQGNPQPVGGVILGDFASGLAIVSYSFGYPSPASFTGGAVFGNPFTPVTSANNSTNGTSGPVFVRAAAVPMGGNRVDGVAYAGPTPNGPWLETFRYANLFNNAPPTMVGIYGNGYNSELNALFEHFETR